jgi:hypothetical protein
VTERATYLVKTYSAGCWVCHGGDGQWFEANAQGVAARHHDATGHRTWVEIVLSWTYGEPEPDREE